ncbi:Kri1-like, C-terminal [Lasallia pustulata]|uniref:Kri1-like, C-terminal n=1 Tax=Lasallia pustulata TaxID=136370 RepID=A0A1W5CXN3_9LECA|nr:Kri1-like, C-terminal [Lasallia pustulata]
MAQSSVKHFAHEDLRMGGMKRARTNGTVDFPSKRAKILSEDEGSDDDSDDSADGGAKIDQNGDGFNINEEYARRFEHNKKREELHRLEEKYGKTSPSSVRKQATNGTRGSLAEESGSSTDSEEEDNEGILASGALDAQIDATLQAIRVKDPRVYDEKTTFYTAIEDEDEDEEENSSLRPQKKEKPMFLSDYHRRNLLEGNSDGDIQDSTPLTYVQQQDELKNSIVKEMHAAAGNGLVEEAEADGSEDGGDDFLVRKNPRKNDAYYGIAPVKSAIVVDVETADKDPESFLSNFMAARAWVPSAASRFQPFESDDDEEEERADAFEAAYNLRFEDPQASNEKLMSHARDAAAKYSVRREATNSRKKARDSERARKEAERRERDEDKARLRKLKIEEVEEKLSKIKEAAGLRRKDVKEQDWSKFLDEGWDDERWEEEMQKWFGEDYYADQDEGEGGTKVKKPKWEDDIDIADLVPEFDAEEKNGKHSFTLTDDEDSAGGAPVEGSDVGESGLPNGSGKVINQKDRKKKRDEQKKEARRERRRIEQLVDEQLNVDHALSNSSKKHAGHFRYRETSPTAFGLTAHDILMASDSQLNQYAGLKKMATFRDTEKKRKDKKRLGKKARLRQWRKETFGSEQGPQRTLGEVDAAQAGPEVANGNQTVDICEGKKRKKRSRRSGLGAQS